MCVRPCVLTFTKIFATPKIMPPSNSFERSLSEKVFLSLMIFVILGGLAIAIIALLLFREP